MVTELSGIKDPELLVGQPVAVDPISVENARVRRQTRQHGRNRVLFGPVKQIDKRSPVRFVLQAGLLRLRAGDDDAIDLAIPEIIKSEIEAVQVPLSAIRPGNLGERVQLE